MSSSARSSRAGVPVGFVPVAGGRIVFELCIRMIMVAGHPSRSGSMVRSLRDTATRDAGPGRAATSIRSVVTWAPYGSAAYAQLTAEVAEAKRSDPLAPVTVLVPTNLCGTVARRHLARGLDGRAGVAGLNVTTLDRLAERIAAPVLVGRGRRPTTSPVLAAAWRRTLADGPGVFAPVAEHPATVRALVDAHRELRDVDEAVLEAIAGAGTVAHDLVALHRRVTDRLHERFYDVTDLRTEAAALLAARPELRSEIGTVVLFLPQDLRPRAVTLLAALRATVDVRTIGGYTGADRADAAVWRTIERLEGVPPAPPAGAEPTAGIVLHASDADDEVRTVVRRVMTALRGVPAHRIAILYGAAHPYARLLAEHLDGGRADPQRRRRAAHHRTLAGPPDARPARAAGSRLAPGRGSLGAGPGDGAHRRGPPPAGRHLGAHLPRGRRRRR